MKKPVLFLRLLLSTVYENFDINTITAFMIITCFFEESNWGPLDINNLLFSVFSHVRYFRYTTKPFNVFSIVKVRIVNKYDRCTTAVCADVTFGHNMPSVSIAVNNIFTSVVCSIGVIQILIKESGVSRFVNIPIHKSVIITYNFIGSAAVAFIDKGVRAASNTFSPFSFLNSRKIGVGISGTENLNKAAPSSRI